MEAVTVRRSDMPAMTADNRASETRMPVDGRTAMRTRRRIAMRSDRRASGRRCRSYSRTRRRGRTAMRPHSTLRPSTTARRSAWAKPSAGRSTRLHSATRRCTRTHPSTRGSARTHAAARRAHPPGRTAWTHAAARGATSSMSVRSSVYGDCRSNRNQHCKNLVHGTLPFFSVLHQCPDICLNECLKTLLPIILTEPFPPG